MNNLLFVILSVVIISSTNYAFAEHDYDYDLHPKEKYDLSKHPVFQHWVNNTDRNFSFERYSPPAVSNDYHLEFFNMTYDPTIRSYVIPVSSFDYCDLEQFSQYPKCLDKTISKEISEDVSTWKENYDSYESEIDLEQLFSMAGVSYHSLPSWMKLNLEIWIEEDNVDSDAIMDAIEKFVESDYWN